MKPVLGVFGRFVGVAVMLYGAWLFGANFVLTLVGDHPMSSVPFLRLVLTFGLLGVGAGLAYLASFDGPARWRTKSRRTWAWLAMLVSVLLPSSITFFLAPLVIIASATLFVTIEAPKSASPAG